MSQMKQPKFKFGDRVITTRGATHDFEVDQIIRSNSGGYTYKFVYKDGATDCVSEDFLQLYTSLPSTYTFTKQQLAEAWDEKVANQGSLAQHENSEVFSDFCKHLGVGNE